MLQIYPKVFRSALEKKFFCLYDWRHAQSSLANTIEIICFTSSFWSCSVFDKLTPLCEGHSKIDNDFKEVIIGLLTPGGKNFHAHRNHLIAYYPKQPLLLPHTESFIERNPVTTLDSDTSDMVQIDSYIS